MSGTLAEGVALPGRGALLQPLGVCVARVAWARRVGLGAKVQTHPWWWWWWAPCWRYLGRRTERGLGTEGPPPGVHAASLPSALRTSHCTATP